MNKVSKGNLLYTNWIYLYLKDLIDINSRKILTYHFECFYNILALRILFAKFVHVQIYSHFLFIFFYYFEGSNI